MRFGPYNPRIVGSSLRRVAIGWLQHCVYHSVYQATNATRRLTLERGPLTPPVLSASRLHMHSGALPHFFTCWLKKSQVPFPLVFNHKSPAQLCSVFTSSLSLLLLDSQAKPRKLPRGFNLAVKLASGSHNNSPPHFPRPSIYIPPA